MISFKVLSYFYALPGALFKDFKVTRHLKMLIVSASSWESWSVGGRRVAAESRRAGDQQLESWPLSLTTAFNTS